MNILSTITGLLIAAVLSVPGTNQREVTPVEEEPAVKERIIETVFWRYKLDDMSGALQSSNYEPWSSDDSGCDAGDVVCIISFEGTPEEESDLATHLSTFNNQPDPEAALLASAYATKENPDN